MIILDEQHNSINELSIDDHKQCKYTTAGSTLVKGRDDTLNDI